MSTWYATFGPLLHTMYTAMLHTCIHTCMHTYMHACIHAYIHTYIHAYMHATYIEGRTARAQFSSLISLHSHVRLLLWQSKHQHHCTKRQVIVFASRCVHDFGKKRSLDDSTSILSSFGLSLALTKKPLYSTKK